MADSLFNNIDQDEDYLAALTGPGGKFDRTKYTSEVDMYKAMAKSTVHADRTIAQRNTEMDELREEFLKVREENVAKAKWEEILANRQNPNNDTTNNQRSNVEQPVIDERKFEEIAERKYVEIQTKVQEKANLDKVDSRLRERFGENTKSVVRDKLSILNISEEEFKRLASKSPEAVYNILGLNAQPEAYQSLPRSSLRSDNFQSEAEIRDAVYYEKLRQTDSKKYFDPKISVQRLKDMESPEFFTRYNQNQRRA